MTIIQKIPAYAGMTFKNMSLLWINQLTKLNS